MEKKACKKCGLVKEKVCFYKETDNICKECIKARVKKYRQNNLEKIKKYQEQYRLSNKEKRKEYDKKYYKKNERKIKEYHKEYHVKNKEKIKKYHELNKDKEKDRAKKYYNENFEKISKKHKEWLKNNREQQRKYEKNRIKNDKVFKLKKQTRNLIRQTFLRKKYIKKCKTEKILGCSNDYFVNYLLQTFKNNYGYEWDGIEIVHIDHITPLSCANTEEDVIKLCHYSNLQLLKEKDNLSKSNKLNYTL